MPAGLEAGIIAGRQQVKTWALRIALIHDGWVTKVGRCMWSAHRTKTSDDTFEELTSLVESFDWLRKRVRRIYSGNGNHKILFNDKQTSYPTLGASGQQMTNRTIEFGARENGPTGRGRTKINRLTLDEWLMGTSAMKGAQVPMMGAAGDRYIRYGSSPGLLMSEDLRSLRYRGRIGTLDPSLGDPSLSWVEWTGERAQMVTDERTGRPRMVRVLPQCEDPECMHLPGQVSGCYLDDLSVIRASCPAYGTTRLTAEFVAQERLTLSPVEYARERAGIWEDPPTADDDDDNPLAKWSEAVTDRGATAPALAFSASPTLKAGAIVLCGGGVLEVAEYGTESVGWMPASVVAMARRNGIQKVGCAAGDPAMSMVKKEKGPDGIRHFISADVDGTTESVDVGVLGAGDQPSACQAFAKGIGEGALFHRGQKTLDLSAAKAVRKFSGDGWRWSRRASSVDISPLWGAVVAAHMAGSAPPEYDVMDSIY